MSASWNNFSVDVNGDGHEGLQAITEELPACGSCRKRKLRCSREHPACSHCERLSINCVYEPKQKPGLKTGAVEALTRRVVLLEQILLDGNRRVRPQFDLGGGINTQHQNTTPPPDVPRATDQDLLPVEQFSSSHHIPESTRAPDTPLFQDEQVASRKRKLDQTAFNGPLFEIDLRDIADFLPSQPLLVKLVDYFCVTFHHWIPYLHKKRLHDRVCGSSRDAGLDLILHALVSVTLRHLDREVSFLDEDEIPQQTRISRFIVENLALKNVSLESLRALIIIVFDYLNDGQPRKAWPLIGSLTRTVDYLQLTIEPSASQSGALMNPLKLIKSTDEWTLLEEQRRLFWVIFLLDRFCSVSTGWNTSLTSEDVHRRLPADGGYFTREEPVTTPYFGIWNKSSAKIGRSLAHVPAQYNEDDPAMDQVQGTSPGSMNGLIDCSKLGAFAYCIEATESLSQVTTFFLQQRINWQDKEHTVSWLTRFKELDLRLVQWKIFLPPRWKDSDISPDTTVVDMDPNLTLAHITHNTSMILLHHPIAYPPKGWNDYVALPKDCSAKTCELAAIETSNIVDKFLIHRVVFVNAQFAFCAFVAAKTLLFEYQASRKPLRPEFQVLVRSLWEMSRRWRKIPIGDVVSRALDQAGLFARHLEYLLDICENDTRFKFDFYDHSCQKVEPQNMISPAQTATPAQAAGAILRDRRQSSNTERCNETSIRSSAAEARSAIAPNGSNTPNLPGILYSTSPAYTHSQQSPNSVNSPFIGAHRKSTFSDHGQAPYPLNENHTPGPTTLRKNGQDQSLLNLSDAFMDSQFLGLDRVITFEDGNFFLPGDGFRWH